MGNVSTEHEQAAAPEVVADAVAAQPAGALPSAGLSPASVLALQGLAGNRAVRQVLARAGARPARRAIARAPSVSDEVFRVTQELDKKQPPDASVVADAVAVATRAYEEAKRLKATGAGADKLEDAYKEVQRVVSSLIANQAEKRGDRLRQEGRRRGPDRCPELAPRPLQGRGEPAALRVQGRQARRRHRSGGDREPVLRRLAGEADERSRADVQKLEEMGLKGLPNDPGVLSLTLVSELLKQYFSHAPADVKPDPMGKVSGLKVDSAKQLEADCDVYAAYGARLLRAAGWQTVGYMAFVPDEGTGRDAHAVALAKRSASSGGSDYASLSNWEIKEFKAASDDEARAPLLKHALEIYASLGEPSAWKAYYLPAASTGAFDMRLVDPVKNGLTPYKTK